MGELLGVGSAAAETAKRGFREAAVSVVKKGGELVKRTVTAGALKMAELARDRSKPDEAFGKMAMLDTSSSKENQYRDEVPEYRKKTKEYLSRRGSRPDVVINRFSLVSVG